MNWLKIQYPAGAGGKIIMYCISTSKNVIDLGIKNDPVEFTKNNFPNQPGILPIDHKGYPYDLTWFSRQYPFTRGHHLSQNEVDQLIEKDLILKEAKKNNTIVPFTWCRLDSPQWFNGKTFSIGTTPNTLNWLLKRRIKLFYLKKGNSVIDLRHHMSNPLKKKYQNTTFKDTVNYIYSAASPLTVAKKHFGEDRCPEFTDTTITIDELLNKKRHPHIFDQLENCIGSPLDRRWCQLALITWTDIWKDI